MWCNLLRSRLHLLFRFAWTLHQSWMFLCCFGLLWFALVCFIWNWPFFVYVHFVSNNGNSRLPQEKNAVWNHQHFLQEKVWPSRGLVIFGQGRLLNKLLQSSLASPLGPARMCFIWIHLAHFAKSVWRRKLKPWRVHAYGRGAEWLKKMLLDEVQQVQKERMLVRQHFCSKGCSILFGLAENDGGIL